MNASTGNMRTSNFCRKTNKENFSITMKKSLVHHGHESNDKTYGNGSVVGIGGTDNGHDHHDHRPNLSLTTRTSRNIYRRQTIIKKKNQGVTNCSPSTPMSIDDSHNHHHRIRCIDTTTKKTIKTQTKAKCVEENAKKRQKRMEQTRKRRQNIDEDRLKHLQQNSGVKRQQRIKKRIEEERMKHTMVSKWIMIVVLGLRIQAAVQMVQEFRQYRKKIEVEERAARIITRQLRMLKFRLYRKRVRGAIQVLASIFLVKVRLWKTSRRTVASDRVIAFLVALERDNADSGGCLALIVKGKKWRAYRLKIIILQRLWRRRLQIISSQILLIDQQWQLEQKRRTENEVDRIYIEAETRVVAENEHIETINRTRKLLQLRPLPKKKCNARDTIRDAVLKGIDFLSSGHIVPIEIRHGIIRNMLTHLRCMHLLQLELYDKACKRYEQEAMDRQRRRALFVGFSGNGVANTWVWGRNSSRSNITEWESNHDTLPPMKPMISMILGNGALSTLLTLGQTYVDDLRHLWNPQSMEIVSLVYNGKDAAEAHFHENPRIVATIKRNESFLSHNK